MNNLLTLIFITAILIFLAILSGSSQANWIINETQNTPNTQDTLPEGVSEDWINSLTDERGNRIIQNGQSNNSEQIPYEDPEGDAMQRKIFTGPSASSQFGSTVSNAGDLNGDGYDDIIVGAYGYTSFTGRVYIYFGGIIMNTTPDLILTGEATSNFFGWCVSGAGDINADGYSDVIIGADGYGLDKGRAYVYFGGAVMNNTPDMIMTGKINGNRFATSVSAAGDINGDGYSDVILGELNFNSNRGRAYVYYGGISPDTIADLTITGEAVNNYFGLSVSEAGDVNGDGFSDFITGAYGYSGYTGRAYVFFGGNSPDTLADVIMTGETTSNYFGVSVSEAGDVNGDGFADVIAGAYGYSTSTGKAYIYFGSVSPDNSPDVTMAGETINNQFGISVSSAGDLNGDGYSDVIAGASKFSTSIGKAYMYFGGISMNNISDVTMTGETTGSNFGYSVSSAGDVNGDGYSDVICGANWFSNSTGRVYLYDYFMKSTIVQDLILTGENVSPNTYFGTSVSNAGDVNGDGYSDVIIGANEYSGRTGRAYIYYGGLGMDNTADVIMTGETSPGSFGLSVSSAGDVNGDGFSDVIVGAYEYSTYRGRAYIYFGGASMNNIADVTMTGDTTYLYFGLSVSSAGDVNGDGYSDVIVGANGYSSSRGRANIYFGGASMDNISDVNLFGEASLDDFGRSVSSAGDMNGDGYSDVIIGANEYSTTGRAYIYFGGSPMNSGADVTIDGENSYSYFGNIVSLAGDVNGDGYSDVMVATYHPYAGNTRVYIFHGGSNVNNVPDLYMSKNNSNYNFGRSVASAGDINDDGYSDIMISFTSASNGGYTNVYFGGAEMDSTEDVTMYGDTLSTGFGGAVSSAGDINGDGYSDLIVGASTNYSKGRAYIYKGSAISAKPILNFVKDVPNDQGGYLNIKWARSSFDVNGNDLVTSYSVLRSFPPSGGNFSWQEVANVTAQKFASYTFVDHTPYDSTSNSSGTMYYRIKANTNLPSQYWLSGIISGRSIDNIAPLMVSPFSAAPSGNNVRLTWNRSAAPDLLNYILYRSVNPTIDPYTDSPLGTATDSTFLDTSPLNGSYYYFIIAQDIHGNYSPVAVTQKPSTALNLSMLIEGFYNAGTNSQVSDTINVQLRNSASPFAVVDQTKGILASDGTSQLTFGNAESGNYYISITHRNSIETWSSSFISLTSGGSVSYDFTPALLQAFGNNLKQVDATPLKFGIFVGDQNQDGVVTLNDIVNVYNNSIGFLNGYVTSDMNGDNVTDLSDLVLTSNNAGLFVAVVRP